MLKCICKLNRAFTRHKPQTKLLFMFQGNLYSLKKKKKKKKNCIFGGAILAVRWHSQSLTAQLVEIKGKNSDITRNTNTCK